MRGTVWMAAGDFATAALFFDDFSRLEPQNADYASLHLHALSHAAPAL